MTPPSSVYLVDDAPGLRRALQRLLELEGLAVRAFASAEEFLAALPLEEPACLVLDVDLPGLDGLALQERLGPRPALPIVFLTGKGDIPMSVRAMKAGAVDFLTKPVEAEALLAAVRAALARSAARVAEEHARAELGERLAQLTPREREVLEHVLAGRLNKQIAAALGIGEHTVKVHRGRAMEKLALDSVAELARVADRLGLEPAR